MSAGADRFRPDDILFPYQKRWKNDKSRFKAGLWSRQTGKDFSMADEIVEDCLEADLRGDKTGWMIPAPSERQALESLEKCRDWMEAWQVVIDDVVEDREAPDALMRSTTIFTGGGSRIMAVPGRPDTVRGFSMNVAATEFAYFDDPDATWRALLPSITNPLRGGQKKMRVISTANGKSGRGKKFYEILRDNLLEPKKGRKQKWSCHLVTIEDAVREGLPIDIDELREGMDDSEGWAQEMMCEFVDSSNVLLPYELIALAESSEASSACDFSLFGSGRDLVCGIDFGRTNDPTVCITAERVGLLLVVREVLVLRSMPSNEQEKILLPRIMASRRTCYDYSGPGIGLGDYLVRKAGRYDPAKHHFGKLELLTFTQNLKRDIFPKLRRAFEAPTSVRIPIDIELREDLHAMQQIIKAGGFSYEAPRTVLGHSDRCTALALMVRAADQPRTVVPPQRFKSARRLRQSGGGIWI